MPAKTVSSVIEILTELSTLGDSASSLIVAIDGRGGAGKSTLAKHLVTAIPGAAHIEYDWFHLPKSQVTPERRFDHSRLLAEVIEPYVSGIRSFRLRRYNWGFLAGVQDGFHTEPAILDSVTSLIIEGCETLHQELSPHFSVRIWIDTSAEESKRRGVRRDIEEYKLDPEKVTACWDEWVAREAELHHMDERRCRADIILT